jgi:sigma-54 dependent transcriptional regulator, acetoin dehydrogenase operon transcriptional activator AcoR
VVDYAAAMCRGGVIGVHDLPDSVTAAARTAGAMGAGQPAEAQLLQQYLRAAQWNVSAVAHQMGVSRMTLYRRMKRWGIQSPKAGGSA